MLNDFRKLTPSIRGYLEQHHALYTFIKVKDYLWEHVVTEAFKQTLPDLNPLWNYGSQQIGKDVSLANGLEISCKSGQIHSDGRIKISSSRLSRLSDNALVKQYLQEAKTDDYIFCLSTYKTKQSSHFGSEKKYVYSVFKSDVFNYREMTWDTFGKDSNLRGQSPEGVTVTCTKAMGWQVWYYLPRELSLYTTEIVL